uniref:Uncharacterized protein n=1 Tax=viral metagenome TaxID=1070528 RepID=A0A6C0IH70_9ZZZZ
MNRTRKKPIRKKKYAPITPKSAIKRGKATRRICKWKGGASSFTVKFSNNTKYQVVVEKNHVKANDEYDEEHAKQLVKASINIDFLRKNILKHSGKSVTDTLSALIVNKWNIERSANRPLLSYAILLKNANHTCTKTLIEESLLELIKRISPKRLNDLEIHSNTINQYSNNSTNNVGVQHVMEAKTAIYDNIATLLALGFIGANNEWFKDTPNGKMIQKTQRDRFLAYCKIPSSKPEERDVEDKRIRDVIAELS